MIPELCKHPVSKPTGNSGSPSRYSHYDNNVGEYVYVELYPQNSWRDLSEQTLLIPKYNNVRSDRDECEERVKEYLSYSPDHDLDESWLGVSTIKDYTSVLTAGDLSNDIKLNAEIGQAIQNLAPKDKKRRKKWINNEDGDIMFDAYMNRDPEIFYAKRLVEGKKFKTNLVIATGGNCGVNPKTLKMRAEVYAKIIDELQRQGHNVGVYACDPIYYSGTYAFIMWQIKQHNEQMALPMLQRDLGHPAVYRTAVFDIISSLPTCPGSGLGRTAKNVYRKPSTAREVLSQVIKQEIGEPTVVLNLFDLNANISEEKLHKKLPEIADTLNNLVTDPRMSGIHYINTKENDD